MDTALKLILSIYQWILENGDKRTDPWLMVYSPIPVVVIFLAFLCVILVGPYLMKPRKPFDLSAVLIVYNCLMVWLSVYMFREFLVTSWLSGYSYLCQPVDYSTSPLAMRVCIILRKKNSQLTYLHIFHHGSMILFSWAEVKHFAGGQLFFTGWMNNFVHIIMYSYYGLAVLGMQKYLWWKQYLTILQLVQFVLGAIHAGYNLLTACDFPHFTNAVVFCYCLSLIVLFSNFYIQHYKKKGSLSRS